MILIREDRYGSINLGDHPTLRSFPLRRVRGYLWLQDCPLLRSLPTVLEVGRTLDLSVCPSLTRLPTTLRIGLALSLDHTPVTELPEDLEVGWSLFLRGSKIKRVPKSARIAGQVIGLV